MLKFPATLPAYATAFATLRRTLDAQRLSARRRYYVELVFEEIVSNIIRHGDGGRRDGAVEVAVGFGKEGVVLRFDDDGAPFDPRNHEVPDAASLEEARVGGLGLKLVRHASSRIDYERTPQQGNRVTITIAAD